MRNLLLLLIGFVLVISGCVGMQTGGKLYTQTAYEYTETENSTYSDKNITASISPIKGSWNAYKGFNINIQNKTKKEIKIIWNESYYLDDGRQNGNFMLEGMRFVDRNSSIKDDIVLPGKSVTFSVWPINNANFTHTWDFAAIRDGNHGAYIKIKEGNREKAITLTVDIKTHQYQAPL